jgi:ABC-type uncharacterized transport system permease subunit
VFQATIFLLYLSSGLAFAASRFPRLEQSSSMLRSIAFLLSITGVIWHCFVLLTAILSGGGIALTIGNTASFIGLQLGLIAILGAIDPSLRGLAGGLLILSGFGAIFTSVSMGNPAVIAWQMQAHVLISLFAYGLLTAGAIVAVYALVQDSRLRAGRLTAINHLFAPLETNERLLYGIAASGLVFLVLGILSGLMFVDNIFAQHLVHKSALSIVAVLLFSLLLAGRHFAGWRGRHAVYLYLWGFFMLGLAYFGSRFVLENMLGKSWG